MRLLLTTAFCIMVVMLYAQRDKLYLKDGSTLEGKVGNLKGNTVALEKDNKELVEIATGDIVGHKALGYRPGESAFKQLSDSLNSRYQNGPRLQIGIGLLHDDSRGSGQLEGMLGLDITYRFGQYLQFGWGFNYHEYELVRSIPVYFIYQGDLTFNKSHGPYYFVNIGKSTSWGNDRCDCEAGSIKGGLYLSGGLGYRWDLGSKSFFVQGGWLQERITTTFSQDNFSIWESRLWAPNDSKTIIRQKINSINLIIGINF